MSGIYWLASYPKSGNTWLRIFLTNYWRDSEEATNINALAGGPIASAREVFDDMVGVEASDLTPQEIESYRPRVYEQFVADNPGNHFLKVHDALTYNADGVSLFSKAATAGVIYLIRNPLDVAVSYAHHSNAPIARAVNWLCRDDHAMVARPDRLHNQLPQKLLSWSNHVRSWVDEPNLNVHVVRYEDMKTKPGPTFRAIVDFAGLAEADAPEKTAARIEKGIAFSSFAHLQAQEAEHGFREKMPLSQSFFHKGETGSWRDVLNAAQVARLIETHRLVMHRFGYLNEQDEPVY